MFSKKAAVCLILAALTAPQSAAAQDLVDLAIEAARRAAEPYVECVGYLRRNQCNAMDRCLVTKKRLTEFAANPRGTEEVLREQMGVADMDCCCIKALVGGGQNWANLLNYFDQREGLEISPWIRNGCDGRCP